jgi:hypothetical protein
LAGYVLPPSLGQPAVQCTGSSYAPANYRLKRCLPCASGFEAPPDVAGVREDKNEVCREFLACGLHGFETHVSPVER